MEKQTDHKFQSPREERREGQPVFARELWFTAVEDEMEALRSRIEKNELTATVRLGDRSSSTKDPKGGYGEGRYITIKLQKQDKTFYAFQKEAVVLRSEVKKLGDILPEDLRGTLLDGKTKEDLKKRFRDVYEGDISDEELVTITGFEYQDSLRKAGDLVRDKVLSPAKQPKNNPDSLNFERYTLPLLEHDYPAKTAIMWNEAYRTFGMDAGNSMMVGNPEFTRQILEVLSRDHKYLGGGAGVGFKDEAIKYLDELDERARAIGSVNFILKSPEGKLRGYNTDGVGYVESLNEIFRERSENLKNKRAVILGAGGTGNAVAFALAEHGMRVVILNRTAEKARELAEKINHHFGNDAAAFGGEDKIAEEVAHADAVINVSTKGSAGVLRPYSALAPAVLPATPENIKKNIEEAERILGLIPKSTVLSDIVLTEKGTPFLRSAKEGGFTTLDGLPMVVNQGAEAFWILHGQELEGKGVTKKKVEEAMKAAAHRL